MAFCGYLKQSTVVTISLGPFLDDDDALTEKTGLTIADTTVFLSKNGGAKANPNDTNDCTEDANGVYLKQIDGTDTGTLGLLTVYIHETDALYIRQDYMVIPANVWDSWFSTDKLQVHVAEITAGIIANASFNADVGSTAHGTNIIALAVRKILEELNLDHLMKVVTAGADMTTEIPDNTALSRILANGDTSGFVPSTDGLQPIRDVAPHGSAMVGTNGANTTVPDAAGTAAGLHSTTDAILAHATHGLAALETLVDEIETLLKNATYGLSALRTRGDAAWVSATGFSTHNAAAVKTAIEAAGSHLTLIKAITDDLQCHSTTIASVDTADTKFILTDALTGNDDINDAVVSIYDVSGSKWSGPRRVVDYIHATKLVEINADTAFPLAAGDLVRVWNCSFAPTVAAGGGATAQENWEYANRSLTTPKHF